MSGPRVRHSVALVLKHDEGSTEEASFLEAAAALADIPGVERFELLREISTKNDFRFVLAMEFADEEAYRAYDAHADHRAFVESRWIPEVTSFVEIDTVAL